MDLQASCCIAVISSTLSLARQTCNRIKALSGDDSSNPLDNTEQTSAPILWTISNKYYSANVHFKPLRADRYGNTDLADVPAVIYVWSHEEEYKKPLEDLSKDLKRHDPEVLLAIRTSGSAEDDNLEDFLNEKGFELIYGHDDTIKLNGELEQREGPPRLNRAIDALSTIMWPNMVQFSSTRARKNGAEHRLEILGDNSMDDIEDISGFGDFERSGMVRIQRDLEQLEKWFEESEVSKEHNSDLEAWVTAPPSISISSAHVSPSEGAFDDDFTDFVSALPSSLSPSLAGPVTYHSLPSVSDFGEHHIDEYVQMQTDTDDDIELPDAELPSPDEIRAATARIYGQERNNNNSTFSPPNEGLDLDSPAFDLSNVFGALQAMKEEIDNITDEKEKRQAAARAALGLVYGLDIGDENLEHAPSSSAT